MKTIIKEVTTRVESVAMYAPSMVRIGVAMVFLWFGANQLLRPGYFIGYLPKFIFSLPGEPATYILLNGGMEIVFGTLLLLGFYTRISALILGLHLAGITYTVGWNEIGARDFGLTLATLSVVLSQPDVLTIDATRNKRHRGAPNMYDTTSETKTS